MGEAAEQGTRAECDPQRLPATDSFGQHNVSADAACLHVAVVHGLREYLRNNELSSVARFDLVIDLVRALLRVPEEYSAVFLHIDIIDAVITADPGTVRRIDHLESSW